LIGLTKEISQSLSLSDFFAFLDFFSFFSFFSFFYFLSFLSLFFSLTLSRIESAVGLAAGSVTALGASLDYNLS